MIADGHRRELEARADAYLEELVAEVGEPSEAEWASVEATVRTMQTDGSARAG